MNPADFWRMSWRDFQLKRRGFFEMKNGEFRTSWEQARMIAFYSVTPYDTKRKISSPQRLFKFQWEKDEVRLPTKEEMRYWMLKYGKFTDENGRGYNA